MDGFKEHLNPMLGIGSDKLHRANLMLKSLGSAAKQRMKTTVPDANLMLYIVALPYVTLPSTLNILRENKRTLSHCEKNQSQNTP
jgi:hypothetical protein